MSRFPFSKNEQSKIAKSKEDTEKRIAEVREYAGKCLGNEDFQKYRERYESIQSVLLNEILDFSEPDPIKYAFIIKSKIERYNGLCSLLNAIEKDAGRGLNDRRV